MNAEFLEALEEMAKDEGLDREDLYEIVKHGLKAGYIEQFGAVPGLEIEIDRASGDIHIIINGQRRELSYRDFGRVATRKAEETIRNEILRKRREKILARYQPKVGQLLTGTVHRFHGADVWLKLSDTEALLPEEERIPGERYREGAALTAVLIRVERTSGDPRLILSRAAKEFVQRLLEREVPEIQQGLLRIEAIAREPGVRTKVAIRSLTADLDPVGTCVGSGGGRVKEITRALSGEKIDIIRWSPDVRDLIKNCLEPAKVLQIELNEQTKEARVIVPHDELSLAIGKGGQNVRLTAKLTSYKIDVLSPEESQSSPQA
ncbi:MAG: transcription termination factor NusA [Candidatus Bipolaricaulota bacterium]|nr:transcription termination factor NusA [Candidatus Bipolaricaulota bacterium]